MDEKTNNKKNKRSFDEVQTTTVEPSNLELQQELKKIKLDLDKQLQVIRDKLNHLEQLIIKQNMMMDKVVTKINPPRLSIKIFPIIASEDLETIDERIKVYSDEDILMYIKELIGKAPLYKCIDLFFDPNILLQINWDGNKQKFPLKKLKIFNTYLFDAVKSEDFGYKDYVEAMKKAIHNAKGRIYKNNCRNRAAELLTADPEFEFKTEFI